MWRFYLWSCLSSWLSSLRWQIWLGLVSESSLMLILLLILLVTGSVAILGPLIILIWLWTSIVVIVIPSTIVSVVSVVSFVSIIIPFISFISMSFVSVSSGIKSSIFTISIWLVDYSLSSITSMTYRLISITVVVRLTFVASWWWWVL